jgi:CBS domain-containing protein
MMPKKLRQIMVKDVITVQPDTTVKNAVELMNAYEISCLVVVSHEKPIGIVTEQDMVRRVIHKSRSPEKTRVSEIMSKPLIVATPNMHAQEAAKFMLQRNIRRLPVMENERLVGLVTLTDLISARVQRKMFGNVHLSSPRKLPHTSNSKS